MSTLTRTQRKYDHRLRDLVQTTGSIVVAVQRGVPRSTAYGWLNKAQTEIVTLGVFDKDAVKLQHEVITLRRRNARLIAVLRLLVTVLKVTGFFMSRVRLPEKSAKRQLLRAVKQAHDHFPLRTVLGLIGLTHGRFHSWKQEACGLNDVLSCPKSSPQQLTGAEVSGAVCQDILEFSARVLITEGNRVGQDIEPKPKLPRIGALSMHGPGLIPAPRIRSQRDKQL